MREGYAIQNTYTSKKLKFYLTKYNAKNKITMAKIELKTVFLGEGRDVRCLNMMLKTYQNPNLSLYTHCLGETENCQK